MSDTNNKVRVRHWLVLAGLVTLVWVLSSAYAAKGSVFDAWTPEVVAVRGEWGYLDEGTNLCQADVINADTIMGLFQWSQLIKRLIIVGGDSSLLSAEDNALGTSLTPRCGTLAEGYRVVLYKVDEDYALIAFGREYNFEPLFHIIRLDDFLVGEGKYL